jgi:hypothetical protein|tara:strand:- start:626 stop:766 length:141 start_codon:yes stop_codon:yes gene_type:complete
MGRFARLIGLETEAPKPADKKPTPKASKPKDEPKLEEEVSTDEESE